MLITVDMQRCAKRVSKMSPVPTTLTMTCWAVSDFYFFPFHPSSTSTLHPRRNRYISRFLQPKKCQPIPTSPLHYSFRCMVSDGSQTLPLSPTERLDRRPEKEFGVAFTHVDKRSTDTSKHRVTTIGCTCEISPAGTLPCSFMAVLTKATSETCRMVRTSEARGRES